MNTLTVFFLLDLELHNALLILSSIGYFSGRNINFRCEASLRICFPHAHTQNLCTSGNHNGFVAVMVIAKNNKFLSHVLYHNLASRHGESAVYCDNITVGPPTIFFDDCLVANVFFFSLLCYYRAAHQVLSWVFPCNTSVRACTLVYFSVYSTNRRHGNIIVSLLNCWNPPVHTRCTVRRTRARDSIR